MVTMFLIKYSRAVKRAEQMLEEANKNETSPVNANPSTTVHTAH